MRIVKTKKLEYILTYDNVNVVNAPRHSKIWEGLPADEEEEEPEEEEKGYFINPFFKGFYDSDEIRKEQIQCARKYSVSEPPEMSEEERQLEFAQHIMQQKNEPNERQYMELSGMPRLFESLNGSSTTYTKDRLIMTLGDVLRRGYPVQLHGSWKEKRKMEWLLEQGVALEGIDVDCEKNGCWTYRRADTNVYKAPQVSQAS